MATAKQLTEKLKETLMKYRGGEMSSIKTWKRGVLPVQPVFPASSVMIERVEFGPYSSSGQYEARWSINLEFFTRHRDPVEAKDQVRRLAEYAKRIIKTHFQLDNVVIDTEIFPEQYSEVEVSPDGQLIQTGTVPLRILSYETLPKERIVQAEFEFTDSNKLLEFIFKELTRYKGSSTFPLSRIEGFWRSATPSLPKYPALTIVEAAVASSRQLTGLDMNGRLFNLSIFTQLLPQEVNLDLNLTLIEVLVDVLQIHYAWGGRCINSFIDSISFVREELPIGRVYRSTIEYICESPEELELPVRLRA